MPEVLDLRLTSAGAGQHPHEFYLQPLDVKVLKLRSQHRQI